ncbi:D-3-phosphoglycerate dehydrogenase [Phycisphaerae bacterium RAS1]|nr:D-3-phosphoglycerate dehydrogenase [Phycisphaerae bacterium RAS1]
MKILIADKFEAQGVDELRRLASEVHVEPDKKGPALLARVAELDPNVLIVRSTKVGGDVMSAGKHMRMIIRAGSGYDTIDLKAASERGIFVTNCPGQNAEAVAELTMGLLVALDRRIPDNVIDIRSGRWNKAAYGAAGRGLKGRTLGIIGAGRIGTEVARRASAFEMTVLYSHLGRSRRLADFANCRRTEISELLRESDAITIHVPGGDDTKSLIDDKALRMMKPTALLINTSRAGVVDEAALAVALREGRLRGAALDVFAGEPAGGSGEVTTPLADVPNLYVTHHIGASTEQAQLAVAHEVVKIVTEYKNSGKVRNCVNLSAAPASHLLVVRLVNKPGGLAHVFNHIAVAGINVEEVDHVIYDGGKAACAHIRLGGRPSDAVINSIRTGHPNVIGVEVTKVE